MCYAGALPVLSARRVGRGRPPTALQGGSVSEQILLSAAKTFAGDAVDAGSAMDILMYEIKNAPPEGGALVRLCGYLTC